MKTLFASGLLLALAAVPAAAGDPDFHAIVRSVETGYGVHRLNIPLFGLARFAVQVAKPEGVKDFDMAIFQTPDGPPLDGSRFDAIVKQNGGGHWDSAIRVHSRRDHEWTYIYVRPEGRDWRMIVATFEPNQTVLLHAKVDPEVLVRALDDPEHAGQALGGPHDEE
jgi:hypothetical protein